MQNGLGRNLINAISYIVSVVVMGRIGLVNIAMVAQSVQAMLRNASGFKDIPR